MSSKNGSRDHDMTPEVIDQALKLYDLVKQAATSGLRRVAVEIPEWGVTLWVQALGGDDRDDYEQWYARERQYLLDEGAEPNVRGIRAKIAVLAVVDEQGNHLFTDDDRAWLGQADSVALDRIFAAADRLSGLTGRTQDDIRKNSEATPGVASSSASPSDSAEPSANSSPPPTPAN